MSKVTDKPPFTHNERPHLPTTGYAIPAVIATLAAMSPQEPTAPGDSKKLQKRAVLRQEYEKPPAAHFNRNRRNIDQPQKQNH